MVLKSSAASRQMNRREFISLGSRAAVAIGVAAILRLAGVRAANNPPPAQESFTDKTLNSVVAISLLTELSPEAQTFVLRELKISKEELGKINTFIIPEELMEGMLDKEDLANETQAYFYMYREQFKEHKATITARMDAASRKQFKKGLTYAELAGLYDGLEKKIFGATTQKKQYAIMILPKDNTDTQIIREFRILHELKHHAQNLPVYLTDEKEYERVEEEATAFQMRYLMTRGFTLAKILEAFDVPEKLTGKESRAERKEIEKNRKALTKMWEGLKPKLRSEDKSLNGIRAARFANVSP